METTETSTTITEQLVSICKDREAFWKLMGDSDPKKRINIHDQLWDTLMNVAREKKQSLTREHVTEKMQPSTDYQRRMGCTEPVYVCRRKTCVNSNPSCVAQKISEHLEVIRQQLAVQ
ncbi:hypothetical protein AMJ86_04060 [bacterium SM23_57]|nr:MAG: hypothetical protein AMJ86_04060 [bacterium SM23_57]